MTTPALPSATDLKGYLRIETDAELALLRDLLLEVVGLIESSVGKSLTKEDVTWYDEVQSDKIWEPVTSLFLQYIPIDVSTLVVKDFDGDTVLAANYVVRDALIVGQGSALGGRFAFDNGPYTITCTAGYGTDPNYATRYLPAIRALMLDYAAFLYQQRTPGATSTSASGTRVDYAVDDATGLPKRVAMALRRLRGVVITRG